MKKLSINILSLLVLSELSFSFATTTPSQIPSSALPARVQQALSNERPTSSVTQARLTDKLDNHSPDSESSSEEKAAVQLKIDHIQLVGNNYPIPKAVQALAQSLQGQTLSLVALQQKVAAMQQIYRAKGFMLTKLVLPPQKLTKTGAVIKVHVIEGYIDQVIIQNGKALQTANSQLERYIAKIKAAKPLTMAVLEKYLMLANNIPGITVKSTLVASKTHLGAANLIMQVTDKKLSGYINFNNRGTEYIGPQQLLMGFNLNRLMGADQFSFNYATSMPQESELTNLNGAYQIQFGTYGTQLEISTTYTSTHPAGGLAELQLAGSSFLYQATLNQPLFESRAFKLSTQLGLYHLDSRNVFPLFNNQVFFHDRVTALTWALKGGFQQALSWNQFAVTLTKSVPWNAPRLPASPSRDRATADFSKLEASFTRSQYLPYGFTLVMGVDSQYTNQHLLSSEQIGYGGQTFGQAYDSSIITGDKGLLGRTTLQYTLPQHISWLPVVQPFVYYDIGKVWNNLSNINTPANQSGASIGGGINFASNAGLQASLILAKPLTLDDNNGGRDLRIFFNVSLISL